ncbi:Pentatricopeptide repeat-containing protein [Camellia lanceoleosa]|uniref:Pentatricopeptide repeat-containing protein n=1 Tax=Camellia lanceoleosa TaxID=1840588 RepID=A0ACC0J616_9ERIC|nr:Pentatricopeptide repeat-containing protein [Camellia lanceoleosa]
MDEVRSLARDHGLKKTPGWSSIELNNMIDVFYTENQSYSYCEEIYKELEILAATIKITGYIPDYSFVLLDVEEDEKEYILMSHSEKLVITEGDYCKGFEPLPSLQGFALVGIIDDLEY